MTQLLCPQRSVGLWAWKGSILCQLSFFIPMRDGLGKGAYNVFFTIKENCRIAYMNRKFFGKYDPLKKL